MKKMIDLLVIILVMLSILAVVGAYGNGQGRGMGRYCGEQVYTVYDDSHVDYLAQISSYPLEELSQDEIDGLLLMREEEKLARDVYLELYDIFGQQIFSNIARSEDTHTNAIKSLLDKYGLEDPVKSDERGVFENDDLKDLYGQLVEQGSNSLVDALKVGATVEDLDIKDLNDLNFLADNQDITTTYDNLERGSRNHMRSFNRLIERNGGTYEPQYISEDYYDSIINGDMESGAHEGLNMQDRSMNMDENGGKEFSESQQTTRGYGNMFTRIWMSIKSWFN